MQKEILKIIRDGESDNIEFKENFGDETVASLTAMANFKGGKVLLGINDFGKIIGIKIGKESIQKWMNEIKSKTEPYLNVNAYEVAIKNKTVVVFEILEFPLKPVSFKNRYYIRKNNSNHILSLQEVADMHLLTKNSSWDFYPDKNSNLDMLDQDKIFKIKKIIEENLGVDLGDNFGFLRKYSLIVEEKGNEYPTFASMLLFSKENLMKTDIQIGLFQINDTIKKNKVIANDLISEVEEAMDFIESYIFREYIFTGKPRREEKWQYPITALRELVINAVVHRDYREGVHSQFKVFPDKIIFWNIGKLPYDLSLEDIKKGIKKSYPRNKLVAKIFRDCGLIERYGSGIKKVIDQFREYGLEEPIFNESAGGIEVVVRSENVPENVLENVSENVPENRLRMILDLTKFNKKITALSMAEKLKVTEKTIKRDIEKLKQKGFLKRIGPAKGGHWERFEK